MSPVSAVPHERPRETPIDYSLIFRNGMFHWMKEAYLLARISGLEGIHQWQKAMGEALDTGYEAAGAPRNSGPEGFLRYVVERDRALGIPAGGEILDREVVEGSTEPGKILSFRYWINDPFLPLKDELMATHKLEPEQVKLEYRRMSTEGYLAAKIRYFCPDFTAEMVKSTWKDDDRTEWILRRHQ